MIGIIYMYVDMIFGFYGHFIFNCVVGGLNMIVLDTCCVECLIYMFCIFVFAPVQRH